MEKLQDLNAWYIRESADDILAMDLIPFLEHSGLKNLNKEKVKDAVATLKIRSKTLVDMAESARFYFEKGIIYDEKADNKFLKSDVLELLVNLQARLEQTSVFDQEGLEKTFVAFLEANQIKLKKVAQPLRVALTGKTASPGIFEVMEVLGKESVLERLGKAVTHIRAKA